MTYHTPELLLVGTAQTLILVTSPVKELGLCDRENAPPEVGFYESVDTW
jgi:hypothetical protein